MNTMVPPQPAIPSKVTLPEHRDAYYGGKWHVPKDGRYADTINPGTGESLGKVAECGAPDMDAAIDFYRRLGLDVPDGGSHDGIRHVEIEMAGGVHFDLDNETLARVYNAEWRRPGA